MSHIRDQLSGQLDALTTADTASVSSRENAVARERERERERERVCGSISNPDPRQAQVKLPVPKFHASRPGEKEADGDHALASDELVRLFRSCISSSEPHLVAYRIHGFRMPIFALQSGGSERAPPAFGAGTEKREIRGVERPSRNLGCGMMLVRVLR